MTKQVPKINVRLLRRVQEHIKAEPRRLKMKSWIDRNPFERSQSAMPPCGTTACIAGWALTLAGKRLREEANYMNQGRKILGLTHEQAKSLFLVAEWPAKFQSRYDTDAESVSSLEVPTSNIAKNARVAVARIDHFIKTGE